MLSATLVYLVVFLHVWFFVLESFLWTKPFGRKLMGLKIEQAQETKVLAMNQGLYNAMVAAYLAWSFCRGDLSTSQFILVTIIVAGIFGAVSAKKTVIFFIQAVPAALALGALCF